MQFIRFPSLPGGGGGGGGGSGVLLAVMLPRDFYAGANIYTERALLLAVSSCEKRQGHPQLDTCLVWFFVSESPCHNASNKQKFDA